MDETKQDAADTPQPNTPASDRAWDQALAKRLQAFGQRDTQANADALARLQAFCNDALTQNTPQTNTSPADTAQPNTAQPSTTTQTVTDQTPLNNAAESNDGHSLANQQNASGPVLTWAAWWTHPLTKLAAGLVLSLVVLWTVIGKPNTQAAYAEPVGLAEIHRGLASGQRPHLVVGSVDQANQLLAQQAAGIVPLPDLPESIESCCLQAHAGTTLTCAVIQDETDPTSPAITVAVADAQKLQSPNGQRVIAPSRTYMQHTVDGIRMVMAHQNGRWLCVMGQAEWDRLQAIAESIAL